MSSSKFNLPPEQQAIRAKCFHPSGTFVEFAREDVDASIPQRFEKMVQRFGDRPAVKSRTETLTYAELNNLANRLATRILNVRPHGPESVAVLVSQKTALIYAILAILKTGKFVVLLDPSFPQARNLGMLENSQSRLVIADRENIHRAIELLGPKGEALELDLNEPTIRAAGVRTSIDPKDLAFVFYTSGSTGDPKGVMQTHQNILHNLMLRTRVYHVSQHDRISLLTSGTSSAVINMFLALLNGAASLAFDVQKQGLASLGSWLASERISICFISGPLFRAFYESFSGHESLPHLRAVRLTSEAIYDEDVNIYKKIVSPQCVLVNGLSSSETGPLTKYLIDHTTKIVGRDVPVGFANPDKEIFLVDDNGDRIGANKVGEIVVRSRYLSPGYWRRPDLTQVKFKSDPQEEGIQIYFSGDLGIMLPDGCILHRGRKDLRVKIRGYSVEVAEIESALRDYPAIGEAVVVARPGESGEARLIAYFSRQAQSRTSVSELRRFLRHKLPDYMIPSAFVLLDAMPITSTGKIDRKALPEPKNSRHHLNTPFISPRTSHEEKLATIWAKELGVDPIGIHDDFFDLGGHSLLAMRVISQIRDDLQVELSLNNFFETPTVAALADYIETAHAPRGGLGMFSIPLASRDREILPSFSQQSLWLTDQLEAGSPAYNLFSATKLKGPLNVIALEQSFNEIIRRHEILRTVFRSVNGQPFQIILPALTIALSVVDLRDIASPVEREAAARRLSTAEARRPFDLERGPLLRATLLRLTADTHVLFLTIHHIIFDAWSRKILVQELATFYEGFSSGSPALLPALPVQYADFAHWQRRRLQEKALEEQLAYWKVQLKNLSVLKLPSDHRQPAVRTFKGERQYFALRAEVVTGLKILARQEGVTLFMTLLAAYLTLLHRYTGQNDIGIGSPISGRDRSELQRLIGFFLNMLVLRTDLSGNPTFRELLSRVRRVCVEAYANQDVPFEKVVQELQPERSLSLNPLFQVTFALQDGPTDLVEPVGMTAEDVDLGSGISNFDLQLFMIEGEATLNGWLIYSIDLFDAVSIARMANHFQIMLEAVVANPDRRIGELSMLTEAEKHQLLIEWNESKRDYPTTECIKQLCEEHAQRTHDEAAIRSGNHQLTQEELNDRTNQVEAIAAYPNRNISDVPLVNTSERRQTLVDWNRTRKEYPGQECLHDLFEEQVKRTPEAVAVVYEGQKLTYRELNQRANHLAHRLRGLGVRPDVLVGLCVERSIELLIGVLGVLKAGGAYAPLDPSYPKDRLDFMLKDSAVSVVLTRKHFAANLSTLSSVVLWDLDRPEQLACNAILEADLESNTTPDNLAYMIYTSGSTGQPKGVLVKHHNVVRLFQSSQTYFDFNGSDVWTFSHSCAFDFSVWEIWGALLHGGRLVIVPDFTSRSPDEFATLIQENSVTVLNQTPSGFQQLMPHLISKAVSPKLALRYVIFGGETLETQRLQPWLDRYGDQTPKLINMYGITETTVHATYRSIARADIESKGLNIIGRPISDLKIYVLDSYKQLQPIGIPGEIYIGGAGVAKGYHKRPELTAERFIADPFSDDPQARLYKTGDLARWLPNGELEYLGRMDDQVKIRGYRIELGEIECVLNQYLGVEEVIVVAREDDRGDKCIVAYVVAEGPALDINDVKRFLRTKVPEYMIPTVWVTLSPLPRLPNGKVDRASLPAPAKVKPGQLDAICTAWTPLEKLLTEVWAEALPHVEFGIEDNFFELGGHSLLATRVVARLGKVLNTEIPLRFLFEAPTIHELALRIVAEQEALFPNEERSSNAAVSQRLERLLKELETMPEKDAQSLLGESSVQR